MSKIDGGSKNSTPDILASVIKAFNKKYEQNQSLELYNLDQRFRKMVKNCIKKVPSLIKAKIM
jgi:hypothetical protein